MGVRGVARYGRTQLKQYARNEISDSVLEVNSIELHVTLERTLKLPCLPYPGDDANSLIISFADCLHALLAQLLC